MDLSRHIFDEIMVEREGFAFNLEVFFEWLPDFCSHCKVFGHDVVDCLWLHPKKFLDKVDRGKKPEHVHKPTIKNYVGKLNNSGIGSSKSFQAHA
jgi:hypothetical protein